MAIGNNNRRKVNNNYYLSPFGEEYLAKCAVRASVMAIVAAALWVPSLIIFFAAGMQSLIWTVDAGPTVPIYVILFFLVGIAQGVCAVMSFYGFKIRKQVKQTSAPTLGFKRTSYNGIMITAIVSSALFLFQIVLLIGYHVALGSGYIESLVNSYSGLYNGLLDNATLGVDVTGIIVAVLYALNAAADWVYYAYTFRVNRTMQLVCPDAPPETEEEKKAAKKREIEDAARRSPFGLSKEEKKLGRREWEDYDPEEDDDDNEKNEDKSKSGKGGKK